MTVQRTAEIDRKTGETEIQLSLNLDGLGLDGSGNGTRTTGVGFLDHMLDLFAKHACIDLSVRAAGDVRRYQ